MKPVGLDYDREVMPLTPKGNATERHICEAYSKKGDAAFWRGKLGDAPSDAGKLAGADPLQDDEKGGVGYVRPGKGSFPLMAEMNRFVLVGGDPTLTWLDGTSDGEKAVGELYETAIGCGAAALALIRTATSRRG